MLQLYIRHRPHYGFYRSTQTGHGAGDALMGSS